MGTWKSFKEEKIILAPGFECEVVQHITMAKMW